MRNLPPLAAIRVFEAAARHENFTSAADELGMTQAAVSYQVKSLEGVLGLPLFLRQRGRVSLTETGAQLAVHISSAFDTLDDGFARLRADDAGTLRINSYMTVADRWLANRLGSFQLGHPDIAVQLLVDNAISDFARDNLDVAIRGGSGEWPGLHSQFLMRMLFAPIASAQFVADHGPFESPGDILNARRLSPGDMWWSRWIADAGLSEPPKQVGVQYDSQTVEGNAALAGQGIAMLTPAMWANELRDGRLIQLGKAYYFSSSLWVVCPESKRNQPKVKAFRDWAIAEVENVPMREQLRRLPGGRQPTE